MRHSRIVCLLERQEALGESILSYMLKAPLVPRGTPVINALMKQQRAITNLLCALVGLPVDGDMMLAHRLRL